MLYCFHIVLCLRTSDFAAAMGQQRPSGPAPPPRLTSHQRQIMQRLVAAHGDDVEVGCRDAELA